METFSGLLPLCAGNSPVTGEFHAQRPVTRSFGVFFHLSLNKRLGKQWRDWWFETPSRPLWRHCNALVITGLSNGLAPARQQPLCMNQGLIVSTQTIRIRLYWLLNENDLYPGLSVLSMLMQMHWHMCLVLRHCLSSWPRAGEEGITRTKNNQDADGLWCYQATKGWIIL